MPSFSRKNSHLLVLTQKLRTTPASGLALLAALSAAILQLEPGAQFSATGEKTASGIPLAVVFLAVGYLSVWIEEKRPVLPRLNLWQCLFFSTATLGILGLHQADLRQAMPDIVQLAIYIVIAPCVVRHIMANQAHKNALITFFAGSAVVLPFLKVTGILEIIAPNLSDIKYAVFVILAAPFLMVYAHNRQGNWPGYAIALHAVLIGITLDHGGLFIAWLVSFLGAAAYFARQRTLIYSLAGCGAALALSFTPLTFRSNAATPWEFFNIHYDQDHLKRFYIEGVAAFRAPRYYPLGGGLGHYKQTINDLKQYYDYTPHPEDTKVRRDGNSQLLVLLVEDGTLAALAFVMLLATSGLAGTKAQERAGSKIDQGAVAAGVAMLASLAVAACALILATGTGLWLGALLGMTSASQLPMRNRTIPYIFTAIAVLAVIAYSVIAFSINSSAVEQNTPTAINRQISKLLFGADIHEEGKLQIISLPDLLTQSSASNANEGYQVEAETTGKADQCFQVIPDPQASGGQALAIPANAVKGRGEAHYDTHKLAPGDYELYARVKWLDGCSNSIKFSLNDQQVTLTSDIFKKWHVLTTPRVLSLSKQPQEGIIQNLENGIKIDYWGLRRITSEEAAGTERQP